MTNLEGKVHPKLKDKASHSPNLRRWSGFGLYGGHPFLAMLPGLLGWLSWLLACWCSSVAIAMSPSCPLRSAVCGPAFASSPAAATAASPEAFSSGAGLLLSDISESGRSLFRFPEKVTKLLPNAGYKSQQGTENLQQTHCHLFAYLYIPRLRACVPSRSGERFTPATFPAAHCQPFRQLHSVFKGGPAFNSRSLQFIYKSCFFLIQPILALLTAKCRVYFEGNVILKKKENKKLPTRDCHYQ